MNWQLNSYEPLRKYLSRPYFSSQRFSLSFEEIESILGARLPEAARLDRAWWSNHRRSQQASAWLCADCRVISVDFVRAEVRFQKPVLHRWPGAHCGARWDRFQIRSLRRYVRLTQAAFAQLIGVLQQTVSDWENGCCVPTDEMKRRLTLLAQRSGDFTKIRHP